MDEQIKALLNQVRILEEEANKHSGAERAELFKAAAKVKMEVIKLLPKQGKQTESKVPDLNEYFCAKEGANKQVISSQADSLIKISRIWADFFPAYTSNQPI